MGYRGMTELELQDFVQEFRAFQGWCEYASYARDLYGRAAELVEVLAVPERRLGLSGLEIESVNVYDAQRRPLEPDLRTEWWQAAFCEYFPDDELYSGELHDDWLAAMIAERRAILSAPASGFDAYLVSRPPRRSHATLYIREEPLRYGARLGLTG